MKVGDLVRAKNDEGADLGYGLVVNMSRTGHQTHSAQILFNDGQLWWIDSSRLETINESR